MSLETLTRHFGGCLESIRNVVKGRKGYKHLSELPTFRRPFAWKKLRGKEILQLRSDYKAGIPVKKLLAKYGISKTTLWRISKGTGQEIYRGMSRLPNRKKGPGLKLSPEEVFDLRSREKSGVKLDTLARTRKIPRETLRRAIRGVGGYGKGLYSDNAFRRG